MALATGEEATKAMAKRNGEVDAYIAKAQPFARPILEHIRELVHTACPNVEETIKWSRPFFAYKGTILANMSGFKAHCSFGFWGREMAPVLHAAGVVQEGGMGSLGRITGIADLPADKRMVGWIRQAAGFIADGEHLSPIAGRTRVVKAVVAAPVELVDALAKDERAAAVFAAFSPSCRREYVDWIASAKREETRAKRVAEAVLWIGKGKQRNWRYER